MAEIEQRLRAIEQDRPPDLWPTILYRSMDERLALVLAPEPPRHPVARRVAAALVALAVTVSAFAFARAVFRSQGIVLNHPPSPSGTPRDWNVCTNTRYGYAIGYPADWHAGGPMKGAPGQPTECGLFDPNPVPGPKDTGGAAFWVYLSRSHFTGLTTFNSSGRRLYEVLSKSKEVVAGRSAVRIEYQRIGHSSIVWYVYWVQLGHDRAIEIGTHHMGFSDSEYLANKAIVDRAAATLRIFPGNDTSFPW